MTSKNYLIKLYIVMKEMGGMCVSFLTNLVYPTPGKLFYLKSNK